MLLAVWDTNQCGNVIFYAQTWHMLCYSEPYSSTSVTSMLMTVVIDIWSCFKTLAVCLWSNFMLLSCLSKVRQLSNSLQLRIMGQCKPLWGGRLDNSFCLCSVEKNWKHVCDNRHFRLQTNIETRVTAFKKTTSFCRSKFTTNITHDAEWVWCGLWDVAGGWEGQVLDKLLFTLDLMDVSYTTSDCNQWNL